MDNTETLAILGTQHGPHQNPVVTPSATVCTTLTLDWLMVHKATFNNISIISWRSLVLVQETGLPSENHRLVTDKLHIEYLSPLTKFKLTKL